MNLNKSIRIERRSLSQDSTGQQKETWKKIAQTWASVRPKTGREYYNASGQRAEVTHEIVMRFGVKLRPADRIKLGARIFDVVTVFNTDERDRYLKAMSVENARDGI